MTQATATQYQQEAHEREVSLKASLAAATEALQTELAAGRSECLQATLDTLAQFPHYSFANVLLIRLQCQAASRVQSYRAWERIGYHVAKGQTAIRIYAPRLGKVDPDVAEDQQKRSVSSFVLVPVFDVSQLNPDELAARPLPTIYHDLGSDTESEALVARMVSVLAGTGIQVIEDPDLTGNAQGFARAGEIHLRAGLASRNQLRTLAHEWAHHVLHIGKIVANGDPDRSTRAEWEHQAEASSYVVLARFGFHNDISSDYLQSWGATTETVSRQMAAITLAARQIITAIEAVETAPVLDETDGIC